MFKILIIDDEKIIRERLSNLLKLDGFDTYIADSGINGLEIFNNENIVIVLVDIKMPGMDGIEILKAVKKKSGDAEVIMITGHGGVETAIQALQEGAFGYVQKPIEYEELIIQIKKAIEKIEMQKKISEYVKNLEVILEEKNQEITLRKKAETELRENINQGREYQSKLMKINFPKVHNMKFYSNYIPYDIVGGDLYNIIKIKNNIVFYLSDLAGHGIPSAILSSFIKALIDNWIIKDKIISPKKIITLLGKSLKDQEIFKDNMLTIFIACLNIDTLNLIYVSAGHFLPFIFKENKMKTIEFIDLKDTYMPITNIITTNEYKEQSITLENNTQIFLYSDGIIEWLDEENNILGIKGLNNYINKYGLSKESIENFLNGKIKYHQKDDISYIIIEINNNYEKTYTATLDNYFQVINDFENEIKTRYTDDVFCWKTLQCLNEIIINAIEHGNKNDITKKIEVKSGFNKNSINITVCDEGVGFNWKNTDYYTLKNTNNFRGRGLFIIKNFSNTINFNEKGNVINITIENKEAIK